MVGDILDVLYSPLKDALGMVLDLGTLIVSSFSLSASAVDACDASWSAPVCIHLRMAKARGFTAFMPPATTYYEPGMNSKSSACGRLLRT